MSQHRIESATSLTARFAERTGLASDGPLRRYLWTDAFAVANLLGLARATGEALYRRQALELIQQVHRTLGRHREDDPRQGPLSGLADDEAADHPTRGGLRIGKPLPERRPSEPYDPQLEWERDGQYFHYLTRWMHALDLAARHTGEARYNRWARELAATAHAAFTVPSPAGGQPRMAWKMSLDLSRPLVPSMGQHDPLDGHVTALQLRATAAALESARGPALDGELDSFAAMFDGLDQATSDPLGVGSLLVHAFRLEQLHRSGAHDGEELLLRLIGAAREGLDRFARGDALERPAAERLGFRELGLAIGLEAAERMRQRLADDPRPFADGPALAALLRDVAADAPLGEEIVTFWSEPVHREAEIWGEHRDINDVMLATALAPEGYLLLPRP